MEANTIIELLITALKKEARKDSDGDIVSPSTVAAIDIATMYLGHVKTKLYSRDSIQDSGNPMPNRGDILQSSKAI